MCEESFPRLKSLLTIALILSLPFESKDVVVFCDDSCLGLGDVLIKDSIVIVCALTQLNPYEKNYPTHYLELATWCLH